MNYLIVGLKWFGFTALLLGGCLAGVFLVGDPLGLEAETELLLGASLIFAIAFLVLAIRTRWLVQMSIFSLASIAGSILSYPENYHGQAQPFNVSFLTSAVENPGNGEVLILLLYCSIWLFSLLIAAGLIKLRASLLHAARLNSARLVLPAVMVVTVFISLFAILYEADETSMDVQREASIAETIERANAAQSVNGPLSDNAVAPVAAAPSLEDAEQAVASGDYVRANEIYLLLAASGSAQAQYGMGNLYLVGLGVEASEPTALVWFGLAAEQGHPAAMYTLGKLLSRNPEQSREAKAWLAKAAAVGYQPSDNQDVR